MVCLCGEECEETTNQLCVENGSSLVDHKNSDILMHEQDKKMWFNACCLKCHLSFVTET